MPGKSANHTKEQTKFVCSFLLALYVSCSIIPLAGCPNRGRTSGAGDPEPQRPPVASERVPVSTPEPTPTDESSRAELRARGRALFDEQRFDQAAEVLASYDRLYPGDFDTNMELGYIHFKNGDYDDALPRYRKAVDANPKSIDARVGLAQTLERLGRIDNAIRVYDSAIAVRGISRELEPLIIAQANLLNKRGKYDRTLDLITRAGEVFPETPGLSCARGMALAGEGRYKEATVAFSRASGDPQWGDFAQAQIQRIQNIRSGR